MATTVASPGMVHYVGNARTFTVHWADLAKCLPIESDNAGLRKRNELYEMFDPPGHGILFQPRVVRALFRMMPQVSGISDMRLTIHDAWGATRDLVDPIVPIGIDRMDRNQFRCFLIYLWYYFKIWDLFVQLSDQGTENLKASQKHFEEMLPVLQEWGVQDAAMWMANPEACFEVMDRSGQGWVIFDDLASFILRRSLHQLSQAGEEECKADASRLLRRTHPHLLDKPFPKQERNWGCPCPPVPPPGQRRPPMPVQLESIGEGGVQRLPERRYKTQYMCDYLQPQYLPSEMSTAASSPARSRALSRALTPHPAASSPCLRPPSDLNVGIGLIRSSSMPDATMRTQNLDRHALRSKLENHLDMYSTGQMRKLLKVAGGMVVGPDGSNR